MGGLFKSSNLAWGLPVVVALLFWGIIARKGLKTTNDSWEYLTAAQNWLERGRPLGRDGKPLTGLSPLYPAILAGLGVNPWAIRLLHGLALCVVIWVWMLIARDWVKRELCLHLGFWLACSLNLLTVAAFVWTEIVFMALFAVFFRLYYVGLLRPLWSWPIWGLVVFSALAVVLPLQRNASVLLLLAMGLYTLFVGGRYFVAYSLLMLPSVIILGYWVLVSDVAPERSLYGQARLSYLAEMYRLYVEILSRWLVPNMRLGYWIGLIFNTLISILFFVGCAYSALGWVRMMGFLVAVYGFSLVMLQAWIEFGQPADVERYLTLIYPFVVLAVGGILEEHLGQKSTQVAKVMILYALFRLVFNIIRWEMAQ